MSKATAAEKLAMLRYYYKNREKLNAERMARYRRERELHQRGKHYGGGKECFNTAQGS